MEAATHPVQATTKATMNMATFAWMITPILIIAGIALIVIGVLVQVGIIPTNKPSSLTTFQTKLGATPYQQGVAYPVNLLASNQQYLVNFSPLTGYLAGYIGPVDKGMFNPTVYLTAAFNAGIRSFVLPISTYPDNNKTPDSGWPYAGEPAVVCRDTNGIIISNNGMSVRDFVNALLQTRGVNSYYASEPIFLFLEEVSDYVPDPVKQEKQYVTFMSKIASQLSALDNGARIIQFDGYGQLGSLVGGEREKELLTLIPVQYYFNRVVIFTNFKTRLATKSAYAGMPKSLHEYANFIYKPNTEASTSSNQASKSISLTDISGSQINWPNSTQSSLFIAQTSTPLTIPDTSLVNTALSQGVQVIPLPFFFHDPAETKALFNLWKGSSSIIKPVNDAQANLFTRPDPVVPAQPNQTMNARVSPNAQPGQVVIS
jgi:hypothetical protein